MENSKKSASSSARLGGGKTSRPRNTRPTTGKFNGSRIEAVKSFDSARPARRSASSNSSSNSSSRSNAAAYAPRGEYSGTSYTKDRPASGANRFSSSYRRGNGGQFGAKPGFAPRSTFGGGRSRSAKKPMRGEYIDTSKFIYKPTKKDLEEVEHVIKHTFKDFGFDEKINENLDKKGYVIPSPIQDQSIHHALRGSDVIGMAKTGSGKTAAFLLPIIQKMVDNGNQQALILTPTRELATQINKELREFTEGMNIYSTVCVGGLPIYKQISDLRRKNHFIIATPGRLQDLADRGVIKYDKVSFVVLDEVDHMLDMGFIDDITKILEALPTKRQSLFFSATMPPRIKNLMDKFLHNPVTVEIESGVTTKQVEQDIVRVADKSKKVPKLLEILETEGAQRVLIFVETKAGVEKLADELKFHGYQVGYLHGDKPQRARQRTLDDFKQDRITVMIATDVAARGIDVKDITHVINYTIPQTHDDYIHRIGRTGRAGKRGIAYTFV